MKIYSGVDYFSEDDVKKVVELFNSKTVQKNIDKLEIRILSRYETFIYFQEFPDESHHIIEHLGGWYSPEKEKIVIIMDHTAVDTPFYYVADAIDYLKILTVILLFHELRHFYQKHYKNKQWIKDRENYKKMSTYTDYKNHPFEVDARKFTFNKFKKMKGKILKDFKIDAKFDFLNPEYIKFENNIEVNI